MRLFAPETSGVHCCSASSSEEEKVAFHLLCLLVLKYTQCTIIFGNAGHYTSSMCLVFDDTDRVL